MIAPQSGQLLPQCNYLAIGLGKPHTQCAHSGAQHLHHGLLTGAFDVQLLVVPQRQTQLGGTVPMWQWIGDEGATSFSY